MNLTRREFFKNTGAVIAIAATPGMVLATVPDAVEPERTVSVYFPESDNWYRFAVPTSDKVVFGIDELRAELNVMTKARIVVMHGYNGKEGDTIQRREFRDLEISESKIKTLLKFPVSSVMSVARAENIKVESWK